MAPQVEEQFDEHEASQDPQPEHPAEQEPEQPWQADAHPD